MTVTTNSEQKNRRLDGGPTSRRRRQNAGSFVRSFIIPGFRQVSKTIRRELEELRGAPGFVKWHVEKLGLWPVLQDILRGPAWYVYYHYGLGIGCGCEEQSANWKFHKL